MYTYLLKEPHYNSCGHSKLRMRKGNTLSQKDRHIICSYHQCEEARVCIPPFTMTYFPAREDTFTYQWQIQQFMKGGFEYK